LYQWVGSKIYASAVVKLEVHLAKNSGYPGANLGSLSFSLQSNPQDTRGIIDPSSVKFTPSSGSKYTFEQQPTIKYLSAANFEIDGKLGGPPIITNAGWASGMGNSNKSFVPGASYWVQDYGMNEKGRWTVDTTNKAIRQSTGTLPGSGSNVGSRAYPVSQDKSDNYQPGVGDAYTGVWQIDMKIGSNGSGNFCETFYLAERDNLAPGPTHYMDGSGGAKGGTGREMDIVETKWKPNGPQINLPNGLTKKYKIPTSWNPNQYQSKQMGNWSDVGGAPTKQFVTFGAYINNKQLWIYAYKPNGTLWYSTNAIPLKNAKYIQKGPFVPYIGTWSSQKNDGNFYTEYKNYIYVPASKIGNLNPKDDPVKFLNAVRKASSS